MKILSFQRPLQDAAGASRASAEIEEIRACLRRAVRKVCPRWLTQEIDDLVQDALLRLVKRQQGEVDASDLSAGYLYRVAYSTVIDAIRSRRRRLESDGVELPEQDQLNLAASQADPDLAAGITECLQRLGEDRRRALTLHLLGHSIAEVSNLRKWPEKRAENLIYRGLIDLRACLTTKGFAP